MGPLQKDQPFFLYYAITLPHGTHEIDDLGIYADKPWPSQQKAYAAQVTRLDRDVGQLLDLLAELKLDDNTLVMLAGDNGSSFEPSSAMGKLFDQAGNGLRGYKRALYEGALRQAALSRWPGVIPAGRVADGPWAFWDFLPTAPSWPVPSFLQVTKPTGSRSSRFSKVARHRSAIISTGNSTRPTNRSKPSVSATGRPCAMAPECRSNSTISRPTSRKRKPRRGQARHRRPRRGLHEGRSH